MNSISKKQLLVGVLLIAYISFCIIIAIDRSHSLNSYSDFNVFYQAGLDFRMGTDLYYWNPEKSLFIYPPFAAQVFQLLHFVPLRISGILFFLFNALVLLPSCIFFLFRIMSTYAIDTNRFLSIIFLSLIMSANYYWSNLVMFQTNFIWFVLLVTGVYLLLKKNPIVSQVMFILGTFMKIFPVILLMYMLIRHFSLKMVMATAGMVVFLLLLMGLQRGFNQSIKDHLRYYESFIAPRVNGYEPNEGTNLSPKAFIHLLSVKKSQKNKQDTSTNLKIRLIAKYAFFLVVLISFIFLSRYMIHFDELLFIVVLLLIIHIVSTITWTAHLVSISLIIIPMLVKSVKGNKILSVTRIVLISAGVVLGIEGINTTGKWFYIFVRTYNLFWWYLVLLLGYYILFTLAFLPSLQVKKKYQSLPETNIYSSKIPL